MLREAQQLPFAKQPVIERASGLIVGYAGFTFWKHAFVNGFWDNLYRLHP